MELHLDNTLSMIFLVYNAFPFKMPMWTAHTVAISSALPLLPLYSSRRTKFLQALKMCICNPQQITYSGKKNEIQKRCKMAGWKG